MRKFIIIIIVVALAIAACLLWFFVASSGPGYVAPTNPTEQNRVELEQVSKQTISKELVSIPGITREMLERGFFYYILPTVDDSGYIMAIQIDELVAKELNRGQLAWFKKEIARGLVVDQKIPESFSDNAQEAVDFLTDENTQFVNTDMLTYKINQLQEQNDHQARVQFATTALEQKDIGLQERLMYQSFLGMWSEYKQTAQELCQVDKAYCEQTVFNIAVSNNKVGETLAFDFRGRSDTTVKDGVVTTTAYPGEFVTMEIMNRAGTKTAGIISVLHMGNAEGGTQNSAISVDLFDR